MWLRVLLIFCGLDVLFGIEELLQRQKMHCFSCASFVYLPLWQQLMHHYYPPKNFTDRCWQPDAGIGVVPCTSACFTLVEQVDSKDYMPEQPGVMRGCVDRLLLFGLDDDVRNVLSGYDTQRVCRRTDRKLLRLYPLTTQTDLVNLCTCVGDFCNEHDMLRELNSQFSPSFLLLFPITIFLLLRN
ncbi:unnamed protein product [Caenorhabditis bovis]|uniref:Uncharacterized protein n=1 Tax=Caenorhabditis bovis TaxID=2654633 RepID=A0A8S1EK92_9PELO|nr:unnamed protein product [Caenorhabditis bovis]